MSEREVIKMLDNLHRQKVHAESQALLLQEQINGEGPAGVGVGRRGWRAWAQRAAADGASTRRASPA
jgi:hypothetical protein